MVSPHSLGCPRTHYSNASRVFIIIVCVCQYFFLFVILGIDPRALLMLGKLLPLSYVSSSWEFHLKFYLSLVSCTMSAIPALGIRETAGSFQVQGQPGLRIKFQPARDTYLCLPTKEKNKIQVVCFWVYEAFKDVAQTLAITATSCFGFSPPQGGPGRVSRRKEGERGRAKQELQTEGREQTGTDWRASPLAWSSRAGRHHTFCVAVSRWG